MSNAKWQNNNSVLTHAGHIQDVIIVSYTYTCHYDTALI